MAAVCLYLVCCHFIERDVISTSSSMSPPLSPNFVSSCVTASSAAAAMTSPSTAAAAHLNMPSVEMLLSSSSLHSRHLPPLSPEHRHPLHHFHPANFATSFRRPEESVKLELGEVTVSQGCQQRMLCFSLEESITITWLSAFEAPHFCNESYSVIKQCCLL